MKHTALVTGANRGIGLAIARQLAQQDHMVLLGTRNMQAGHDAIASLNMPNLPITPIPLDLNNPQTIKAAIKQLQDVGQHVDILVNNAGVHHKESLLQLTEDQIADSVNTHLLGPLRLIRELLPNMQARDYGRIVNVSSNWGSFEQGMGGPEMYGITKAALNALTVRLAAELPSTIKVNAMCPGWVRTRMGGPSAERSPDQGADTAVWLATLPEDGPTGGFFRDRKPMGW